MAEATTNNTAGSPIPARKITAISTGTRKALFTYKRAAVLRESDMEKSLRVLIPELKSFTESLAGTETPHKEWSRAIDISRNRNPYAQLFLAGEKVNAKLQISGTNNEVLCQYTEYSNILNAMRDILGGTKKVLTTDEKKLFLADRDGRTALCNQGMALLASIWDLDTAKKPGGELTINTTEFFKGLRAMISIEHTWSEEDEGKIGIDYNLFSLEEKIKTYMQTKYGAKEHRAIHLELNPRAMACITIIPKQMLALLHEAIKTSRSISQNPPKIIGTAAKEEACSGGGAAKKETSSIISLEDAGRIISDIVTGNETEIPKEHASFHKEARSLFDNLRLTADLEEGESPQDLSQRSLSTGLLRALLSLEL